MLFSETEKSLKVFKEEFEKKQKELIDYIALQEAKLAEIGRTVASQERSLERAATSLSTIFKNIESQLLIKFFKRPYKIKQFYNNKTKQLYYEVYVPKWVPNFQIGWRKEEPEDETFYTYVVNQFSAWLGEVPEELASKMELGKNAIDATVDNGIVKFPEKQKQYAEELFKGHVLKWELDRAFITKGHEFDVILKIIRSGRIPYRQTPVVKGDMREPKVKFELLSYQKPAVKLFFETGATGVFMPTGAGKSFVAMYPADSLIGKKILITTKTLSEQWTYYFEKYAPRLKEEFDIVTYELLRVRPEYYQNEYVFGVFDECHKLPANTFAKASTLNIKYRMGLSGSPHREDGNEDLIFALTGFPWTINYKDYYAIKQVKPHLVYLQLVRNPSQKIQRVRQLLDMRKKTVIFTQHLDIGERISKEFNIPFIHGETKNRIETAKESKVFVASDVMSLGVSLQDLERIIEVDFLYGSRAQEIQRTGRFGHSEMKDRRHDIIMTDTEFSEYGKRIWVLEEIGLHVKVEGKE